jgi:hypothetical protein
MRKLPVVPICRNPTALPLPPNQRQISRRPVLTKRGASRSSRTLGAGCGGRDGDARRAAPARTAKSCGPDAPTLASSFRGVIPAQATVARKPGHRGEHEVTVKTIAQGRPDVFGGPVVATLVCFITFAREAAGASSTRLSLRPLHSEGQHVANEKLAWKVRRDRTTASPVRLFKR